MQLDERKKCILKAVVDDYIATAEPVGSKSLVTRYHFNVSSATVRNEMAELEELGYLEQPHTSAGRVPSDKGYRAYVDSLLSPEDLSAEESEHIKQYLQESIDELTGLIQKASKVLSEQTGYTSIALSPQLRRSHLSQIKILMIEPGRALVIVVLSAGVVKDRLVRIPEMLDADQLMQIANAIEGQLSGMTLDDITLVTVSSAAKQTKLPESLLNQVLYEAYVSIKQADHLDVYLDGSHNVLSYPEFYDVKKARAYLQTLTATGMIAGYMSELKDNGDAEADMPVSGQTITGTDESRLLSRMDSSFISQNDDNKDRPAYTVRIGQEILLDGLKDCSFVTTTYKMGDFTAGRIGVIGPRRMAYGKVISNISFVKQTLNNEIRHLAKGNRRTEESLK